MTNCNLCDNISATLDSHHIVPREYGGHDGPQLKLCPSCHATLHRCINNSKMKDEFFSIVPRKNLNLAKQAIKVLEDLSKAGNKHTKINLTIYIDRTLHDKIKLAAKDYKTTIKDIVEQVLIKAFN